MIRRLANRYWWLLPIAILTGSLLFAANLLLPESAAPTGLVDCAEERPDDYQCWRDRMQTLVAKESPQVALDDARAAYDRVPFVSSNCHQIAHEIGRAAGHKYADVGEAYRHGDDFCASGYYHGVMEAIAQNVGPDNIMAEVANICGSLKDEEPYSLTHYNCVHGLGHGLMAVVHVELFVALDGCEKFDNTWERDSCNSGVFMENIMSRINPNHDTKYLKDDDPLYPCNQVEEHQKYPCYLMQTSHALTVVGHDYRTVFDLCLTVEEPHNATCLQSLGRDASGSTSSTVESTKVLCELGPTSFAREHCYIGAVKDFIYRFHNDTEGLELCAAIEDEAIRQSCLSTAESFYQTL